MRIEQRESHLKLNDVSRLCQNSHNFGLVGKTFGTIRGFLDGGPRGKRWIEFICAE
jgi:hypothetical protein